MISFPNQFADVLCDDNDDLTTLVMTKENIQALRKKWAVTLLMLNEGKTFKFDLTLLKRK